MLYIKTKAGSYIGEEIMRSHSYTGKEIVIIDPVMWKDFGSIVWVDWKTTVRRGNIDDTRFFFVNDVEIKEIEKTDDSILPGGYRFV